MRPSMSLLIVVSIFMASTVKSFCPLVTLFPALTATVTTMPGIAAPISLGLAGSAFFTLAAQKPVPLTRYEAYSLVSMVGDCRVSQVVDVRKGVHCMIPKSIFTAMK